MRHSILESLTNEQQDQLYDWLLEMPVPKVVEKLALPAPDGFGIKTHITTVRRFKNRRWVENTADQIQAAAQLAGTTAADHATLDNGIASGLKHHLFQRASSPDVTDDQLGLLSRWVHRNEKHKLDVHRVQIARERLEIQQARLKIAETLAEKKLSAKAQSAQPLPRSWKEVGERIRIAHGISKEEWARRQALHDKYDENGNLKPTADTCNADYQYYQSAPVPNSAIDDCLLAHQGVSHQPSSPMPDENCSMPNDQWDPPSAFSAPSAVNLTSSSPSAPSAISAPSALVPPSESPNLQSITDHYNIRRAHEYWAWRTQVAQLPDGVDHPRYVTQHRHCPCGAPSPCTAHENETYGEFPTFFWSLSPHHTLYSNCLQHRHLPYREPSECIPAQFRVLPTR